MQKELIDLLLNQKVIAAIAEVLNPAIKQFFHTLSQNPLDTDAKHAFIETLKNPPSDAQLTKLSSAQKHLAKEYLAVEAREFLRTIETFVKDMTVEQQKEYFTASLNELQK